MASPNEIKYEKLPPFPWEFHPESVNALKWLAERPLPQALEDTDIDFLRQRHLNRINDMSLIDEEFDVVRTEMFAPSRFVKGKL